MAATTLTNIGIIVALIGHVKVSAGLTFETLGHYIEEIEFSEADESYNSDGVKRTVGAMGAIAEELRELADLLDQVETLTPFSRA
jgi:hypothetical protein